MVQVRHFRQCRLEVEAPARLVVPALLLQVLGRRLLDDRHRPNHLLAAFLLQWVALRLVERREVDRLVRDFRCGLD